MDAQESHSLLAESGIRLPPLNSVREEQSKQWQHLQILLSLLVVLGTVVFVGRSDWGPPSSTLDAYEAIHLAETTRDEENTFDGMIVATNEYGSSPSGAQYYPWLEKVAVVEPHKESTLSIAYDAALYGDHVKFAWSISSPGKKEKDTYQGKEIRYQFDSLGKYDIEAYAIDSDEENAPFLGKVTLTARCLYVKREIRQLTEVDRSRFLDAAITMWNMDTATGRTIYGDTFVGMDTFVPSHADESTGNIMCDRWHEGTGFLTHHLALAASFETSLRSIDRRATTPYWDFTIEGQEIEDAGGSPSMLENLSPALTADWFGSVDENSHVQDGRWAHSPVLRKEDVSDVALSYLTSTLVSNSYGFIRAPWNNAPDTELIRHMADVCGTVPINKPIPTCTTHYDVLSLDSFAEFQLEIAGYGHGTMHVNTGGVFGECTTAIPEFYKLHSDEMAKQYTMTTLADAVNNNPDYIGDEVMWHGEDTFTMQDMMERYVNLEYFHIFRTLWRSQTCALDKKAGALHCPDSCNDNESCRCTCTGIDGEDKLDFDWENLYPCMFAGDTPRAIFDAVASEKLKKELVTMICSTGVKEGENVESACPADPVCWMIHPILDRMITYKRLAEVNGSLNFGTMGEIKPFSDKSWLDYSFYTTDDYKCEGHSMFDLVLSAAMPLPQKMIKLGDDNQDGHLSNIEFYDVTDPITGIGLDYIFADFSWEHCTLDKLVVTDHSVDQDNASDSLSQNDPRRLSEKTKPIIITSSDYHILRSDTKPESIKFLKPQSIRPSQSLASYYKSVQLFSKGKGPRPGKDLRLRE